MEKKMDRRKKYDLSHTKRITFKFNLSTDADILDKLDREPSRLGYLKRLIREDIKRSKEEE